MAASNWLRQLRYDPISPLIVSDDEALVYFVRRDLLNDDPGPVENLWTLRELQRILRRQADDGSFKSNNANRLRYPDVNYGLIETWKQFRFLIEVYGCTRNHPPTEKAAEYLFSCQTDEGDIRGILANQYAPYYTGAILGLLIRAGYEDDLRIKKGLDWLLSVRQDDGGWSLPTMTADLPSAEINRLSSEHAEPLSLDRSKPSSHNITGMAIRAFAAHPRYRSMPIVREPANLLKSRILKPDAYTSYHAADYWVRFEFPFWWNNLISALDSLAKIGLSRNDPDIKRGLNWLIEHQQPNGLWKDSYAEAKRPRPETSEQQATGFWVTLAICRVLKAFFG